jgi:small subunit ribosomal protein S4
MKRKKPSEYGTQLREKQKVKRIYGVLEKQFRNYFEKAEKMKGITGENLLRLLELRLDNIVYRLGFTTSRDESRQLIRHGHFLVNGKSVDLPSYQVKVGDAISLKEKSRKIQRLVDALESSVSKGMPAWLELDKANFSGLFKSLPAREELPEKEINEKLIVELYSK